MSTVPSPKAFSLGKVKTVTNGGLDIVYSLTRSNGDEFYQDEYHVKICENVHPDLGGKLKELRPILGRVYNYLFFRTLIQTDEFKATKAQVELAEDAIKAALNKIEVTGFSLSGKDDNLGIVITGKFVADSNMVMAINTHRLKFSSTTYGFEEKMEELVAAIEEEVYAYLFLGKRDQLQAFDADCNPAPHAVVDGKMAAAGESAGDEEDEY